VVVSIVPGEPQFPESDWRRHNVVLLPPEATRASIRLAQTFHFLFEAAKPQTPVGVLSKKLLRMN
jgi:hypothetical protein